jgi:hypothetical protein
LTTYLSDEFDDAFDWDLLTTSRLNTILCGNGRTLEDTLSRLQAYLDLPLHEWSCAGGAPLPSMTGGTLIVTDLVGGTLEQQRAFLEWIDAHHGVRVITLSENPLFNLVKRGAMLERLYYRLNPIYRTLSPNCVPGSLVSA